MTEIYSEVFGTLYELGAQPVPSTSQPWSPTSFSRKGVTTAPIVATNNLGTAMGQQINTSASSSPLKTTIAAGFSTGFIGSPTLYVVPTANHPRQPIFVYKQFATDKVGSNFLPTAWHSGQTFTTGTNYPDTQQLVCVNVPVPLGGDAITAFRPYYNRNLEDSSFDHYVAIWDPWHDEYWDLWEFRTLNSNSSLSEVPTWIPPTGYTLPSDGYYYGCQASGYAGSLVGSSVRTSDGVLRGLGSGGRYADGSFPPTASGIGAAVGAITIDDIMRGQISHGLGINVNCGNSHIAPAIDDDTTPARSSILVTSSGATDFTTQVYEGAIFRIDPTWSMPPIGDAVAAHSDLGQANGSTTITQWHHMVWGAMQQFGFFVVDFGSATIRLDPGTAVGTPYSQYTAAQFNAQKIAIGYNVGAGNPYASMPWGRIQQVQYPF